NAYQTITQMDGQNVLLLKHITLRYDYEDSHIIDYMGPHPLTGKPQTIYEGEGGFFANIHYAIIPYDPQIKKLDRQTLLHLAQGKLHEITPPANINKPPLRVHSFLPGPFLSGSNYLYDMCEWGDTTYQAPKQELDYINMALWDWDYSQGSSQHIWLIVWEGDEEDWLVQKGLLNPFTLTDDLIGVFEIKREQTLAPLTLINTQGDFEIIVQTGTIQKFTR
ncbi:hypothetical protein HUU42_13440, partial [bacterium]|nr:hypothetical protein [bacterium]